MLTKMNSNSNSHPLLVGLQNVTANLENNVECFGFIWFCF